MFPIEKYKFYRTGNKTIAVTTYAGKTVKAVAKCDPDSDSFNEQSGKELAAARCNEKVAKRRRDRAASKLQEARDELDRAQRRYTKMRDYYDDSFDELSEARHAVRKLLLDM